MTRGDAVQPLTPIYTLIATRASHSVTIPPPQLPETP